MNDISHALNKLGDLHAAAKTAETEYEKAAVFAATTVLINFLDAELGDGDPYVGENIERLRWSICAMVGYDIDNGRDKKQHSAWVLAALDFLRGKFGK